MVAIGQRIADMPQHALDRERSRGIAANGLLRGTGRTQRGNQAFLFRQRMVIVHSTVQVAMQSKPHVFEDLLRLFAVRSHAAGRFDKLGGTPPARCRKQSLGRLGVVLQTGTVRQRPSSRTEAALRQLNGGI